MAPAKKIVNLKQLCWFKGINPQSFTATWVFKVTTTQKHRRVFNLNSDLATQHITTASTCSNTPVQNINKLSVFTRKSSPFKTMHYI